VKNDLVISLTTNYIICVLGNLDIFLAIKSKLIGTGRSIYNV